VEAQLAHGGFLLQPTRINQTETVAESVQPLRPHPLSLVSALNGLGLKGEPFFWDRAQLILVQGVAFSNVFSPSAHFLLCDLKQKKKENKTEHAADF